MVRRDADGVYTLVGRNDLQVKVRGTRVNLAEIEQVLLDHGRVVEAAAVGVPDDVAGVRIHAVVRGSRPVAGCHGTARTLPAPAAEGRPAGRVSVGRPGAAPDVDGKGQPEGHHPRTAEQELTWLARPMQSG